jgi:hypothetical protein
MAGQGNEWFVQVKIKKRSNEMSFMKYHLQFYVSVRRRMLLNFKRRVFQSNDCSFTNASSSIDIAVDIP